MFRHKQEHKNKLMITELGFVSNWKMLNMDLTGGIGQFMNQKYAKQRILCHYYFNFNTTLFSNTFPPQQLPERGQHVQAKPFPHPIQKNEGRRKASKGHSEVGRGERLQF